HGWNLLSETVDYLEVLVSQQPAIDCQGFLEHRLRFGRFADRAQQSAQIAEREGDSEVRARELSPQRQSFAERVLGFIVLAKFLINQTDRGPQFRLDL